jgi:hypothetical protein
MIADGWFKVLSLNSHNYVNELIKICKDNKYLLLFHYRYRTVAFGGE